ncbi:GATA transcription factor 25 [Punica granatum]|uniref:Uncharacterized protein n=2 Tax=Punica granatum TaxID=22663 RepID=A0A218W591_PUNGR|nr:GATA transcription factor 25 [Punica granatum]OWM67689.1 hypothetical protein CDL15_Pgr019190 [Punica granatum]PKI73485.1 hypothetical protein CRG98_006066 [Punica granatum]
MYTPMNLPKQQIVRRGPADDDDGDGSSSAPAGTADSLGHPHMAYEVHGLDDGAAAAAGMGGVIESIPPDAVYATGSGSEMAIPDGEDSSQLTLSFRGQVYVFDAVTPKKVHAVLLLLGGCELSSGVQGVEMAQDNHRGGLDFPTRCSQPQRAASLNRFRQKRKERCFDKKVRYSVRQEVALRMQRNKGQFTSSKKPDGAVSWGSGNDSGQDDNPQETCCTHCGISSKCTPMMRRGPSGPRSLCNACGLFWANRGTLRDLSKRNQDSSLTPSEQGVNETNGSVCGTGKHSHGSIDPFSNGDNQSLIAEQ